MCKGSMCKEKCKVCFDKGHSCCTGHVPTFTTDELAKMYYHSDEIVKRKLGVYQVGRNEFICAKPEWVKGSGVRIDLHDCPFLNNDGECSIYEHRPNLCRNYGENINCGFIGLSTKELKESSEDVLNYIVLNYRKHKPSDIAKIGMSYGSSIVNIKPFNKKYLKHLKDDMFFYMFASTIQRLKPSTYKRYGVRPYEKYTLVKIGNELSTMKLTRFKIDASSKYKEIFDLYNKSVTKLYIKDPTYQEIVVNKINGVISGLKVPEISDTPYDDEELSIMVQVIVMYKYYQDFKMKSRDYTGLTNSNKLFKLISEFNKAHGSTAIFKPSEQYIKIEKYCSQIYKNILQTK